MFNLTKAFVNVQAYLPEDQEIIKIIKLCNLKPKDFLWKIWIDEFNYYLHFQNHKALVKRKNIEGKPEISDLYFKSRVDQITSNALHHMTIIYSDESYIWMIGHDDKIRCFNSGKRVSPLILGLSPLRILVQNLNKIRSKSEIDLFELAGEWLPKQLISAKIV